MFPYGQLDKKIEWGKLADLVSWDKAKENYAKQFVKNGHPAHTARIALAALTIKKLCPPYTQRTTSVPAARPRGICKLLGT